MGLWKGGGGVRVAKLEGFSDLRFEGALVAVEGVDA
jgi:hypothetical protein